MTAAGEQAEVSENEPSVGEEKVEEGKDVVEAEQTETEDNNPNEDLKKAVGVAKEWGSEFKRNNFRMAILWRIDNKICKF